MFVFDRKKFFDGYRKTFGPLTQDLVNALEFLLSQLEKDARFPGTDAGRRQISYCLATFKWETAHTLQPIDEIGTDAYFNKRYGPQTKTGKALGNVQVGDGARFHGRGYVQLTGRANYNKAKKLSTALATDIGCKSLAVGQRDSYTLNLVYIWFDLESECV